jgi:hypothetical protein
MRRRPMSLAAQPTEKELVMENVRRMSRRYGGRTRGTRLLESLQSLHMRRAVRLGSPALLLIVNVLFEMICRRSGGQNYKQ